MIPPGTLLRLMARPRLSTRIRLGPEDCHCIEFADRLRVATLEGRLRCVWTHVPNEVAGGRGRASEVRYAVAKAMGMITGTHDYLFLARDLSAAIEMKAGRNGLTDGQRDFRAWCETAAVPVATARSADEAEALLVGWGLLLPGDRPWVEGRKTGQEGLVA